MLKSHREKAALRQLKTEETELHLRLTQIRKVLAVLEGSQSEPGPKRPQCRADLLREYLLEHPEGVRLKDVPAVLKATGHVSFAAHPTTNWVYQLKPDKAYFVIKGGIVTLDPGFADMVPSGPANLFHDDLTDEKAGERQPTANVEPVVGAVHGDEGLSDGA